MAPSSQEMEPPAIPGRFKEYIHEHLRYRFKVFQTEDSIQIVRHIETVLKKGAFGFPPPFLNGSVG